MKLRALEPEDLDLLYEIENDETLWSCGATTVPYSRYALSQYIATNMNDIYQDKQLRLVIDVEGQAVGLLDIFDFNHRHARAEVGVAILPTFRQQGLACKALQLLTQFVRQHYSLHQLYAYVSVDNEPAIKLFESAGYTITNTLRDWVAMPGGTFKNVHLLQLIIDECL